MTDLRMPTLSADPARLRRSGLKWLRRSGDLVQAREAIATCYLRMSVGNGSGTLPLNEEQNDLQVVLAPTHAGQLTYPEGLSKGGYQDVAEGGDWQAGEVVANGTMPAGSGLTSMILAGRRGFENGEGRGSLLAGWHERARGFWEGAGTGRFGTVLALGTCEQTAVFRGEDMAFLSWFARAQGPAQIVWMSDERCVHSAAVVLQHLRRTPAEAAAITEAVYAWVGERMAHATPDAFPAFQPDAARGTLHGRWPAAQDVLYALNLMAEAVGTSPILERSQVLTAEGVKEVAPPDAIAMTLGSEYAPHFRHKRTGWIIAMHGFRFGPFLGPGIADWLRRDFEPMHRNVEDVQRDLAALASEITKRTGGLLVVQNLIASSAADRVSNYAWLGDTFESSVSVRGNEANLMLTDLTRQHRIAMVDSDALAAELGVDQCPDRFHASGELVERQRAEMHHILRQYQIPGF